MIGALLYLRLTSTGNWLSRRLRRLRQPKYFIGAIAGGAYIWFFFIRPTQFSGVATGASDVRMLPLTTGLAMLSLFAIVRLVTAWLAPDKPGLGFSEAEIAFLFPAPVTRRMLVHYKLINSQLMIVISALIVTLLARRWNSLGGNSFTHAVGWWLLMSVFNLHNIGAALTIARLNDRGIRVLHRQIAVSAIIVLYVAGLLYGVWQISGTSPRNLQELLGEIDHGLLGWLLFPFRVVVGPFIAADWTAFALALGPALAVLGAHYLWVFKTEVAFEEASIAQAEKRARRLAALQAGRFPRSQEDTTARRPPFRLDPAGGAVETAFLWKNLLSTRSFLNYRTFLGAGAVLVIVCFLMASSGGRDQGPLRTFGAISVLIAGYTLILGPQVARQDLRGDLVNADLLKTYPLPGWRIVLGELLAPTAILTGIVWLCIVPQVFALATARSNPLPVAFIAAGAISVAALAPLVCFIQLMIPNAAVLFFPSWAGTTRFRDRGIDVMGQRLLFVLGQFLVVVIALAPALIFGVLIGFAGYWIMPASVSTAVGAVAGFVVLGAEIAGGLAWLGTRFEKFDLSADPLP